MRDISVPLLPIHLPVLSPSLDSASLLGQKWGPGYHCGITFPATFLQPLAVDTNSARFVSECFLGCCQVCPKGLAVPSVASVWSCSLLVLWPLGSALFPFPFLGGNAPSCVWWIAPLELVFTFCTGTRDGWSHSSRTVTHALE